MAYLGRQPIIGNYQVLDALTASATATYALTKGSVAVFPQTPANCIVSLNGVIQAPFDSYTISGSNIVFASALTGSDSIDFITVLGDVLNVGTVSDGTITTAKLANSSVSLAKLTATGTKDATTFLRGDNTFATPAGGTNTPAFEAYNAGSQSIATNTGTLMQFPSESFDTDSAFNTSTHLFTVPSGEDGKYFFYFNIGYYNPNTTGYRIMYLQKNGAGWKEFQLYEQYSSRNLWQGHVTMDLVAGNTISLEAYQTSGTSFSTNPVSGQKCFFWRI
jgi:hypothetical protein